MTYATETDSRAGGPTGQKRSASRACRKMLDHARARRQPSGYSATGLQGAIVTVTPDGAVRAMVGGFSCATFFSEGRNLFFGLSLVLRKRRPLPNDLSTRLVFFHICASLSCRG